MRKSIGISIIIIGVILGIYAALWWSFIGGIVDAVEAIRSPVLDVMSLSVGILKVIFAGFIFQLIALPIVYWGLTVYDGRIKAPDLPRRRAR